MAKLTILYDVLLEIVQPIIKLEESPVEKEVQKAFLFLKESLISIPKLFQLFPNLTGQKQIHTIQLISFKNDLFKNSFSPYVTVNKIPLNSETIGIFMKNSLRTVTTVARTPLNFVAVTIFCKKLLFLGKDSIYFFSKQHYEISFQVLLDKRLLLSNQKILDHTSGIRLLNCFKLTANRKNNDAIIISRHNVIVNFF